MTHGGKREGAGRKPGVPNKLTAERQAAIAATGETPKDYMLRVMRDPTVEWNRRDAMAKAAAPYCHPQLASVATSHQIESKYDRMSEEDLIRAICDRANKLGIKIDMSVGEQHPHALDRNHRSKGPPRG
jgi:hypothetical protein